MLNSIQAAIISVALGIASFFGYVPPAEAPQNLGADTVLPLAGVTYALSGGGISSSATSITLASFTIPQTGQEIQDSDLSDTFYITLEPGNRTRQELVSCTTVSQGSGTTATLSGCTRGLAPIPPYTASSTLQFSHAGGTAVIFSDPPQLFNQFAAKANDETITGAWGFATAATSSDECSATTEYCTKAYIDAASNQGAATSTEDTIGLVELAATSEVGESTASSSASGPLVIPNRFATTTPGTLCTGGTLKCLVATINGKINQSFLRLTDNFAFGSTTVTNATTTGSSYFSSILSSLLKTDSAGKLTAAVAGTDYARPSYTFATTTNTISATNAFATSTDFITIPAGVLTASSTIQVNAGFVCDNSANGDAQCVFRVRDSNGATIASVTVTTDLAVSTDYPIVMTIISNGTAMTAQRWTAYGTGYGANPSTAATKGISAAGTGSVDLTGATTLAVVVESQGANTTAQLKNYSIVVSP